MAEIGSIGIVSPSDGQDPVIPNRPGHIYFGLKGEALPEETRVARDRIEATLEVLRELYQTADPTKFDGLFQEVLSCARLLVGEKPGVGMALQVVAGIESRVLAVEKLKIRAQYLKLLGWWVVGAAAILSALAVVSLAQWFKFPPWVGPVCVCLASAVVALWLSFAVRRHDVPFSALSRPDPAFASPLYRILVVAGFTAILIGLTAKKVLGVSVAGFSTDNITSQPLDALLFGVAAGFSEKLTDIVTSYLQRLFPGGQSEAAGSAPTGPSRTP